MLLNQTATSVLITGSELGLSALAIFTSAASRCCGRSDSLERKMAMIS